MKQKILTFFLSLLFSTALMAQNTGFTEDFESDLALTWSDMPEFSITQTNGELHIDADINNKWVAQRMTLDETYDISSHPFVNLKVKTDNPCRLNFYLRDADGTNQIVTTKIYKVADFVNIVMDFSDAKAEFDQTQVTDIIFGFNGASLGYDGHVIFDDLKIGTDAAKMAGIGGIKNQVLFPGKKDHVVLIKDLTNYDDLQLTGGDALIENINFVDNNTGAIELTFDCKDGVTGNADLTLTAIGASGYEDNSYVFNLSIQDNAPPSFAEIEDIEMENGTTIKIPIKNITDGDPSQFQQLIFSAQSDNETALPSSNVSFGYTQGYTLDSVEITAAGEAQNITLTITVDDQQSSNNTFSQDINVDIYDNFNNPPECDPIYGTSVYFSTDPQQINITNITDGDDGSQTLSFTVTSSEQSVIANEDISVDYTQGNSSATINYTLSGLGATIMNVLIEDAGGDGSNNGNAQKQLEFKIASKDIPPTGMAFEFLDFDTDTAQDNILIEGLDNTQLAEYTANEELHIEAVNKGVWNGIWLQGFEVNLSDDPFLSMDVKIDHIPDGKDMYIWMWFWDNDTVYTGKARGKRNTGPATTETMQQLNEDQWTTVTFDFKFPGGMEDSKGVPLLSESITQVLINYHTYPDRLEPTYSGNLWIKNVKIGDMAEGVQPHKADNTLDGISDKVHIEETSPDPVNFNLTGLSNGMGGVSGLEVNAQSDNEDVASGITIGTINPDGTANFTYQPGTVTGEATITVTVSNSGVSNDKVRTFKVNILSDNANDASVINVDLATKYQTIHGFGAKDNPGNYIENYAKDLGASAMRIAMVSNQIEPENDNNDPNILNLSGFNYNAFDWDYYRKMKEDGVETFILTSWSPPAWMKNNLALAYAFANANNWNDNYLEEYYFDEFAESMVAVVKMFKEKSGIDIYAIGIQNEPSFFEPYGSAVLSPERFPKVLEVVGKRFEAEGIDTKLYMPEQVFSQNNMLDYIREMNENTTAEPYCDIIATHNYASDGVGEGSGSASQWENMYNESQNGAHPKELWMTETGSGGNDWSKALRTVQAISDGLRYGKISLWANWGFESTREDYGYYVKGKPAKQYYASKNFFRFIKPGAQQVESSSTDNDLMITSFTNTEEWDNSLSLVVINKGTEPKTISLNITNGTYNNFEVFRTTEFDKCIRMSNANYSDLISIPAKSVTTLYGTTTFYSLTVNNGEGSGNYSKGTPVNISANVPEGKKFTGWTGTDINDYVDDPTQASTTLTMPEMDYSVTANVVDVPLSTLTIVNGTSEGNTSIELYQDEWVTVEADDPPAGQQFAGWTGTNVNNYVENASLATTIFTMPGTDYTLTATYEEIPTYTLTVVNGTISDNGTSGEYEEGEIISIVADTPAEGKVFDSWSGTDVGIYLDDVNASTTNVTMPDKDVEITAIFIDIQTHTVTFIVQDGSTPVENATVTFNSTNETTNSDGQAVFSDIEAGNYDYTVTADEYETINGSLTVSDADVNETVSITPTGISAITNGIKLYPVPARNMLHIQLDKSAEYKIHILSVDGRLLEIHHITGNKAEIPLDKLSNGMFILKIQHNEEITISRFMKK